jgi:hypothetical protein
MRSNFCFRRLLMASIAVPTTTRLNYPSGKRFLLRFKEKGGKEKELPVHHKLEELLDEYLKVTGLGAEPGSPLFPAALGKTGKLSRRPLVRTDAADMLKRRRPGSRIFWRMTAPWKPLSESPATPTAGPRNSTIAAIVDTGVNLITKENMNTPRSQELLNPKIK